MNSIDDLVIKGYDLFHRLTWNGAIGYFKKVLATDPNYFPALYKMGMALRDSGNPDGAIEYFKKALVIDPNDIYALNKMGAYFNDDKKDYDGAIEYFKKVLAIDPNDIYALTGMRYALNRKGDYGGAIGYYKQALAIDPNDIPALNGMRYALFSMGGDHYVKSNYDGAIGYYKQALAIDPNNRSALNGMGIALFYKDNYDSAIEYYDKAIAIDKYDLAPWQNRQLIINDAYTKLGIGECLEYKGQYNAGDLDGAVQYYKAVKSETIPTNIFHLKACCYIGRVYNKQKKYDEAIAELTEAENKLNAEESQYNPPHPSLSPMGRGKERGQFNEVKSEIFRELAISYIAKGSYENAFHYSEKCKNIFLLSTLKKRKGADKDTQVAVNEDTIVSLLPDEETALIEFFISDRQSCAFILRKKIARIPRLEWLWNIFGKPQKRWLWHKEETYEIQNNVVRLDFHERELKGITAEWQAEYNRYKESLFDENCPEYLKKMRKDLWFIIMKEILKILYQKIFAKDVIGHLSGIRKLIFVPTGGLYNFPLHAMTWQGNGTEKYLIDDYAISYAPSASVLQYTKKQNRKPWDWKKIKIFIGNTKGIDKAVKETHCIREKFDEKPIPFTDATEDDILTQINDAHVAIYTGHSKFDSKADSPLSGAGLELKDGFLSLEKIMNEAKFGDELDMVVISGCESAMTQTGRVDEHVSLPAGFFCAGASDVIGSLWVVDDGATYAIMDKVYDTFAAKAHWYGRWYDSVKHLYKNLRNKQDSKADALRNASLILRRGEVKCKEYNDNVRTIRSAGQSNASSQPKPIDPEEWKHPFYWASFCCYGVG